MKPFLMALMYEIGSIVYLGCVLREMFSPSGPFHSASAGAVLTLLISSTIFFVVALYHVKQGVIDCSNERKMRQMAKQVASDALQASR